MKPVKKLNTDLFQNNMPFVSIGQLTEEMVDFIPQHKPNMKGLLTAGKDILFWKDRIAHTERHRKDFFTDAEYELCFESIPDIIQSPDYISVHPKDNSISFIRDFSAHVSVAVRVSTDGKMSYRTMYPLMDAQLTHYIDAGFAWRYKKKI